MNDYQINENRSYQDVLSVDRTNVGADVQREEPRQDEAKRAFVSSRLSYMIFMLCFLLALVLLPSLAERCAYSYTRGVERAKRDEASKFLAEHPEVADRDRIPYVAKLAGPSVVGVKTNVYQQGFFGDSFIAQGQGSGVIVDASGMIVTNFHVICEHGSLVDGVEIVLSDGRTISEGIVLVGFDEQLDVAVLKVPSDDLIPIEWGDSDALEVGDSVLALGNPYGLARTVTEGIVSAKERFVFDNNGIVTQEFLQTDAAVNPGNSGGALVDVQGRLVGINTAIYGQQFQGISFALPVNRVRAVYEDIVKNYR